MTQITSPLSRFVHLLKIEKIDLLQIFYYALFSGIVSLSLPLGIQAIINLIQGAQISTSWIVLVALVTVGVMFSGALQLMQLRIIENIQQRIFTRASFELSYRFPKIKMTALRSHYPPELANRFFDTITIQKGLSKILIDIPHALLQIIFALTLLSFYHPFFILFGALVLLLVYFVFKLTAKKGLNTSLEESKNKYKVAHWIQEIARVMVSLKLSGKTQLALDKNDQLVEKYLISREKHFKVLILQFIQMISFKVLTTAGLLIIGGALVLNQEMNIGQFVAAEIIIILVITSVEKLILGLETFYDVLTSVEKLGQVVDKELESQSGEFPNFDEGISIEFENIAYRVPNKEKSLLENISFEIKPKSRTIILGESGAGKSTLLRMISGVIEHTSGNIFINNAAIQSINLNHYRSHLGLSLSEETTFEGTLKENLTLGNVAISDTKINNALKKVGLMEFLRELPNGMQTMLQPDGKELSQIIAKKIVLARAFVCEPKILILEDALDSFNQKETSEIIDFLTHKDNPWALIVVSSNEYWTQNCEQIITLEKGAIKNIKKQLC
jgi:ABC-type bacteriocin/lantibiotic exporter with double-glycine peptidase domain